MLELIYSAFTRADTETDKKCLYMIVWCLYYTETPMPLGPAAIVPISVSVGVKIPLHL